MHCVWEEARGGYWQPTPEFLPGESHGQRNLEGYSLWGPITVRQGLLTEHIGKGDHTDSLELGMALPSIFHSGEQGFQGAGICSDGKGFPQIWPTSLLSSMSTFCC